MPEANGRHPEHSTSRPVAAPCSAANVGRLVWGLLFLVSSVVNLLVTLPNPELYAVFADLTFLPCHRWLLLHVALPNASVISVLVVLFELATAILLSSKGRAVHWG